MSSFVQQSAAQAPELLQQFLERHSIEAMAPQQALKQLAAAYAHLPYENLSKIVRVQQTDDTELARRLPAEVLQDHFQIGTGGTCFSLTWTLLHLIRALGYQAEPILADRRYGPNTHSALVIWIDGVMHLLDPGYLLVDALAIPKQESLIVPTSFHEVKLTPSDGVNQIQLHTIHQNQSTYRLTYKTDPVDTAQFLKAWDDSFQFDMMQYPVLSTVAENTQFYLQKQALLIRTREKAERIELTTEQMGDTIHRVFGLHPSVISQALQVLR